MKKFTFKGVLDGFRSSVQAAPRGSEQEIQETLRPEHFQLKKTFRHGFPFSPTAIAWDPIQKLLAIGDKAGDLRILGGPGVDAHARHESGEAVVHARFLINEGALVTATADDHIHLWNFRQKSPQIVQSLKFQRERITCLHLPLQSKWLHVGTERGNVHVVHIETFLLSGYVINWNKAIEVTRANHPGSVVAVSDNPLDASKLLIAFESGLVVVWDLRSRAAEWRGCMGTGGPGEGVRAAVWQLDGKQLMTAHADGALATWTTRAPRPLSVIYPHAKASKDGKFEACKPIHSLEWKTAKTGETFVIFSGGLPTDKAGRTHSITVLNGKSTTVLEMEHSVIDFVTLCESPWTAEYQDPYAIVVLLQNDLVVIDLLTPGYPCFENPYPMDIHESPVTCCSYLADCPSDLIPAFYSVGRQGSKKPTGFSEKKWPINGGEWAPASCSYSEIILTGHADGSVKFWDASAGTLQILYKLKSAKVFERRAGWCGEEESPLAVQLVALCAESRRLAVALASNHVVLFKFRKSETTSETHVLDVPYISDTLDEEISPDSEYITGARSGSVSRGGNALDSGEADKRAASSATELRVRGAQGTGGVRKPAGFQAALVCLQQGVGAANIAALTINSSYGLMAWGGERGVVIVDISRRVIVAALGAASLYGTADPWGRAPRPTTATEQQRSPSLDQLEEPATQRTSPLPSSSPGGDTFPTGSLPDEVMPSTEDRTKMEARRKSTTWKGFNLKRQLSKVDLKLKTAFTVAPERKEDIDNEPKSNSQFYSGAETTSPPTEPETEAPTLSARDSPETDSENTEAQSDIKELPSESQHVSPAGGSTDVYDRMHKELREIWKEDQEDRQTQVDITPSSSPPETGIDALELTRASRPDNLPLFEEDGRPIRPPRQNKKDKCKKEEDKRDKRLLSVPNIKYSKQDPVLRDLRKKRSTSQVQPTFAGNIIRRFRKFLADLCARKRPDVENYTTNGETVIKKKKIDKLDSSFSRSRSSSMSSLENISSEGIQCLAFADSYTKKSDPTMLLPTLWIGTTLGSVLTMMINLPEADCRYTQPVVISISGGPIFRLKGSILAMSFLDCNGALIPYSYECWRDENKESKDKRERTPTKQGSSSRMSPTLGGSMDSAGGSACSDRQFVVIASEKQARVVALPSQNCVYRQQIADTDFVVKAEIVSLKDSVCLVNYISTGHLVAYSLPSLRPLIDVDFLPLAELRIAKTFCFSNKGHGLYLSSPTELQKFTIDTEFCQSLNEMLGELFLPRDMPEPPKESFLKGLLFGGGSRTLDREELFGEGSGKPNRAIAKHIPGTSQNIENLGQRASTASSEVSRAHQLVLERGDKLSQLEDRTERMHSHAQEFGSSAHQLMLKYKDKKWYQL